MTEHIRVYRFRLKDKHDSELRRQARAVNFVWNFCRETQQNAQRWGKKWPTAFDLIKLTSGTCKELGLNNTTIERVCATYAESRNQRRKPLLRWRGKKALGWVPFREDTVRFDGEAFVFRGIRYHAWVSRELQKRQLFGTGSFSQDSLGRWYINVLVRVEVQPCTGKSAVGIDLGLRELIATSDGHKIDHPKWYRRIEQRIASAQRANKKRQMKALHAKAANQRADFLHKESTRLVREHAAIFVGDVRPSAIAKTRMGKSALDAGWAMFKQQLEYKAITRGVLFAEVNEAWTTQLCSQCGSIEGPKGVAELGISGWRCGCGAVHDRNVNAAINIRRAGLRTLEEGAQA